MFEPILPQAWRWLLVVSVSMPESYGDASRSENLWAVLTPAEDWPRVRMTGSAWRVRVRQTGFSVSLGLSQLLLTDLESKQGVLMAEQATPVPARNSKTLFKVDRRAWVRFANQQDVSCQPVTLSSTQPVDTAWMGRVRDVSAGGIGLSMKTRFDSGMALIVELSERPKVLRHLLVHVVHATPEGNGRWTIGCTFDCPLSPQELETFLGEEPAGQ